MNHNLTGMVACNPFRRNRTVYEKTIQINDFYLTGGPNGEPLGNIQMLGRITGPILAGEAGLPLWLARHIADHSIHIMAMSEDLPDPNSASCGAMARSCWTGRRPTPGRMTCWSSA